MKENPTGTSGLGPQVFRATPPAPLAHPAVGGDGARRVRFELSPKTMVALVLVGASLWLLIQLWPVLLVLVVALLVAGTLSPVVRWLEERRVRRGAGIAIVFTVFFILALLVVALTIPTLVSQAAALLEHEPALRARLADRLAGSHLSAPLAHWLRGLKYDALTGTIGAAAFAFSVRVFGAAAYGMSALFLGLYIMIDRDRLRGGLFAIVPRSHHIRLSRVMMNLETIVGAYIRGQVITSASIGFFILILMIACGVENAMALALFGAVADVLPYIGIFLPLATGVLSAVPHGPVITFVVLALMLFYMEFEGRVLVPRVYGQALRLPSTVVLFSLLAGGTLMGITGALLALPFAAVIMMLIEELRVQLPGVQEQMADEVLREKDDRGEQEYERR